MKDKIKSKLINLKNTLNQNISPRKQKIVGAAAAVPLIAASTMSGACAGGCPYGLTNDPYPGQCHLYTDSTGDGICDLSQAAAAASTQNADSNTQTTDSNTNIDTQNSSSSDGYHGGHVQDGTSDQANASAATVHDPSSGTGDSLNTGNDYHIIPVSLLIIGAYLFTHYLFSKGILKPQKHKRLWNSLLMGSFLGSGATGVLLIYMINFGVALAYRQGLNYWHVELSLLMVIATLIHFHIYRKPFKNMFKVLFPFKSSLNKNTSNKTRGTSK
ncbi:MAG TPA: hypothetical protein VHO92_08110 [Methanobacterium sp.]|nr:hypothetical protein [Methanobacterium sp.]